AQAMLSAHVLEKPVDITLKRPGIPPGLGALIMRCLEKDRDARWKNAEDMLPQLEALATPSGGITPTDTRPLRLTPPRKKGRVGWIAAAAVAVVLLLGTAGILFSRGGGAGKINELAVLPIQDLSGKDRPFVDAMHDALINALAKENVVG